jgi:hypothetical protein
MVNRSSFAPGQNDVVRLNAGSAEAEDAAKAGKIVGQAILEQSLKTLILRKSN